MATPWSKEVHYSDDGAMFKNITVRVIGVLGYPLDNRKMKNFRSDVFILRISENRTAYCKDHKVLQSIQVLHSMEVTSPITVPRIPPGKIAMGGSHWCGSLSTTEVF